MHAYISTYVHPYICRSPWFPCDINYYPVPNFSLWNIPFTVHQCFAGYTPMIVVFVGQVSPIPSIFWLSNHWNCFIPEFSHEHPLFNLKSCFFRVKSSFLVTVGSDTFPMLNDMLLMIYPMIFPWLFSIVCCVFSGWILQIARMPEQPRAHSFCRRVCGVKGTLGHAGSAGARFSPGLFVNRQTARGDSCSLKTIGFEPETVVLKFNWLVVWNIFYLPIYWE